MVQNFDDPEARFRRFRDGPFSKLVDRSFSYRYLTVTIAIASVIVVVFGLFISGGHLKFIFFPSPEAETIRARIVFNAGTPEDVVIASVKKIEQSLYAATDNLSPDEPLVIAAFTTIGSAGRSTGDNLASMRVQLASSEDRTIRTPEIVSAWRRSAPKIAGVKRLSIYEQRSGPPGRDVDIRFRGGDTATLKEAAEEAAVVLSGFPGLRMKPSHPSALHAAMSCAPVRTTPSSAISSSSVDGSNVRCSPRT